MATMQSEMKEKEAEKDHQLKEVGGGHVWVVSSARQPAPLRVMCAWPQVAADREALKEDYEKIQRMVRCGWEIP